MVKAKTVIPLSLLVAAGIGIAIAAKKAVAELPCLDIEPDRFYYFTYVGPDQTFKAAMGECYDVIYTIDVWSEYYGEFLAPVDTVYDILEQGSWCRVWVLEPCWLYGFEPAAQPYVGLVL